MTEKDNKVSQPSQPTAQSQPTTSELLVQEVNKLTIKWNGLNLMVGETSETLQKLVNLAMQLSNESNAKIKGLEAKVKELESKKSK